MRLLYYHGRASPVACSTRRSRPAGTSSICGGADRRRPTTHAELDALMVFAARCTRSGRALQWLAREAELLARVLEEEVPVLGVCLAQTDARAAGAAVAGEHAGVGWHEIELTQAGSTIRPRQLLPEHTCSMALVQ